MKSLVKKIIFSVLNIFAPALKDRASILMYHSVSERKDYFSAISLKTFNKQMAYLAGKRLRVIPLADLVRRVQARTSLEGAIVLTFDDGYRDNYTAVFPLLKQYGFPATIFVTTDFIGNPEYCRAEELREMHDSGLVSIEPHTVSHPKLAHLSRTDALHEIQESRRVLEDILGSTPTLFAYPYGNFSEETVSIVREEGFAGVVTVIAGTVGSNSDVFQLPRNSVDSSTTFSQFRGKVSRAIDWYTSCKVALRI